MMEVWNTWLGIGIMIGGLLQYSLTKLLGMMRNKYE